jgi:hypothetical protein
LQIKKENKGLTAVVFAAWPEPRGRNNPDCPYPISFIAVTVRFGFSHPSLKPSFLPSRLFWHNAFGNKADISREAY